MVARAREERRSLAAVEAIKDVMPQRLLIAGQNPLILLHSALSMGMHNQSDDFVIGAGAAGCVVAGRLSQTMPETRVALIEAGGARLELTTKVPGTAFIASTSARRNWNFETEPVPALNGRKLSWFQGRILGGSGSINGMLYLTGHSLEYDQWAQLGCHGWSFEHVLPYFKKAETNSFVVTTDEGIRLMNLTEMRRKAFVPLHDQAKPAVGSALVLFASGLLLALIVVAGGLAESRPAAADEVPVAFIRTLGAQAFSVIRSDTPPIEKAAYFRQMIYQDFDLTGICRFVLGPYWRIRSRSSSIGLRA